MPQKTAWEILRDKVKGTSRPAGQPFYNPAGARVGDAQLINVDGVHLKEYTWTIAAIVENTRDLDGAAFKFTDYALDGINGVTFAAEDKKSARLRCFPSANGGFDQIFLELEDEFGFDENFLALVNDDTGKFEISNDGEPTSTFTRVNDTRGSYTAKLLRVTKQTDHGDALESTPGQVEYWDYWREPTDGGLKEFVFVEKNEANGWFQIWRGKEYVSEA